MKPKWTYIPERLCGPIRQGLSRFQPRPAWSERWEDIDGMLVYVATAGYKPERDKTNPKWRDHETDR